MKDNMFGSYIHLYIIYFQLSDGTRQIIIFVCDKQFIMARFMYTDPLIKNIQLPGLLYSL